MEFNITYLERLVLETLSKSDKDIRALEQELKLRKQIIFNVLSALIAKNLVLIKENKYLLNHNLNKEILTELKDKDNLVVEYSNIIKTNIKESIHNDKSNCFMYKKVFMDASDYAVLKGLLYNVESFVNSLQGKQSHNPKQHIIFWGEDKVEAITKNIVNYL